MQNRLISFGEARREKGGVGGAGVVEGSIIEGSTNDWALFFGNTITPCRQGPNPNCWQANKSDLGPYFGPIVRYLSRAREP